MNKKKKVILFFPIINPATKFHWFPFSILTLGATLKSKGFEPVVIDERITPNYKNYLLDNLDAALCFGTTAMTGYQIKGGIDASAIVKGYNPNLPVVWGGRHASLLPLQTIEDPLIDIVVKGQGELTLLEIAEALKYRKPLNNILGIYYKDHKSINDTEDRDICDVRELHGFAWDLIDVNKYINPETRAFAYFSSFGCPSRCGFCTNSWLKRKWMSLRTKEILDDLEFFISTYNFKNMMFQDSNYFVDKKRVKEITQGFIERKFNIKWKASIRADQFWKYEDSILKLLEDSGLCSLFVGIESGSQKMLDLMTKDTTTEDAIKTIEKAKNYNFDVHGSFIFGLPYETLDDLNQTVDHIEKLTVINPRVSVQACFFTPFPNTPLYEMALKLGYKPPNNLRDWQLIREQSEFNLPIWMDEDTKLSYEKIFKKYFSSNAGTSFEFI